MIHAMPAVAGDWAALASGMVKPCPEVVLKKFAEVGLIPLGR